MTIPNKLMTDMAIHGPIPSVLSQLEAHVLRKLKRTLPDYFGDPSAPPIIKDWSGKDEVRLWLASFTTPATSHGFSPDGLFPKGMPHADQRDVSVSLIDPVFKRCYAERNSIRVYRVRDDLRRIVEGVERGDDDEYVMLDALRPSMTKLGLTVSPGEMRTAKQWWLGYADKFPKPKLCAQADDPAWCLWRVDVQPNQELADGLASDEVSDADALAYLGELAPATYGFVSRLSDPEAFAAWMFGIYSDRYKGREIMWLEGQGSDGKSKFMRAYNETIFGGTDGVGGVVQNNTLKSNPGFVASLFVDKRFVYVPDNNNPLLLLNEVFKSLADPGADPVVINHKYGKMYSSSLEANVAILSNDAPTIRDEKWNTSRLLWLRIVPLPLNTLPDPSIHEKFAAEMPLFLAYGARCYANRCDGDAVIRTNATVASDVRDQIEDSAVAMSAVFDRLFVLDSEAMTMTREQLHDILSEETRLSTFEIEAFKRWLKNTHGVEVKRNTRTSGKRVFCGIRPRTSSDATIRKKLTLFKN